MRFLSSTFAALVATAGLASAQGLLSIAPETTTPSELPMSFTVHGQVGYDSNVNQLGFDKTDSAFIKGGVGSDYAYVTERTVLTVGVGFDALYYFDQVEPFDDDLYNARIGASLAHAITDRLSINNKLYFSYEYEPNYVTGESVSRRSDQYYQLYNAFTVDYLWTERVSTSTGYTISFIFYDNDALSTTEDRIRHQFNQLVRYALNENTGLRAEYRFAYVDYDNSANDSTSHYALVGLDHAFSENTTALVMAGAQFFDYDARSSRTRPFVEAGISHFVADGISVRWANRLSFEDAEVALSGDNYSYRTSLDVTAQLDERVSVSGGLAYIRQDYSRGAFSRTDNVFSASLGAAYRLTDMISLNAGYTFSMNDTDIAINDYDRHRVYVGASATF